MKVGVFFVVAFVILFQSCRSKQGAEQLELIRKLLTCIEERDTVQLYNLVDTSYFNDVYGMETWRETIELIRFKIEECDLLNFDSLTVTTIGPTSEYSIPFCRQPEKLNRRLVIGFREHADKEILFFNVRTIILPQDSVKLKKLLRRPYIPVPGTDSDRTKNDVVE